MRSSSSFAAVVLCDFRQSKKLSRKCLTLETLSFQDQPNFLLCDKGARNCFFTAVDIRWRAVDREGKMMMMALVAAYTLELVLEKCEELAGVFRKALFSALCEC